MRAALRYVKVFAETIAWRSISKNATGKQKNITSGEKQWVANGSPRTPAHHALLRYLDKTDDRKEARKHDCDYNYNNECSNLPANRAADLQHPEIVLASLASRKSRRLRFPGWKSVSLTRRSRALDSDHAEYQGCQRLRASRRNG
jgi:hypothetical protein